MQHAFRRTRRALTCLVALAALGAQLGHGVAAGEAADTLAAQQLDATFSRACKRRRTQVPIGHQPAQVLPLGLKRQRHARAGRLHGGAPERRDLRDARPQAELLQQAPRAVRERDLAAVVRRRGKARLARLLQHPHTQATVVQRTGQRQAGRAGAADEDVGLGGSVGGHGDGAKSRSAKA